jgi:hypothetical protein
MASDGDLDRVKLLVAQGADPAYTYRDVGWNAIMEAADGGRIPVVEYLISLPGDHTADVSNGGDTALILAVCKGKYELIDLLLKNGRCDPTVINNGGNTAITYAVVYKHVRIVQLLLSDTRVVMRAAGVPPAVVKCAIARNAWKRRRAVVCAWFVRREVLGYKAPSSNAAR